jgi:MFS family permease
MEKAAASNFLGAVLLSRLFDTVGRVRMISGTYLISGILLAITGVILGSLTAVTLTLCGAVIFFFASAGASSAYLTVSEIFPWRLGRCASPSSTPSGPLPVVLPGRCSSAP